MRMRIRNVRTYGFHHYKLNIYIPRVQCSNSRASLNIEHTLESGSLRSPITPHAQRKRGKVIGRGVHILLASERSERDTLRSVQLRIADIYIICNSYTMVERDYR